jgi:hypothetical protein
MVDFFAENEKTENSFFQWQWRQIVTIMYTMLRAEETLHQRNALVMEALQHCHASTMEAGHEMCKY